jgi:hypothetical protein
MMNRLRFHLTYVAVALVALLAASPAAAQCNDGREGILADIAVGSNAIQWRMAVEHKAVTLVVSAPCGLVIERTYDKGDDPLFDLREIPADPDGTYHWQLRIVPSVDSGIAKEMAAAHAAGQDGRLLEYQIRQKGLLPEGPFGQSGSFTVVDGRIEPPDEEERSSGGKLRAATTDSTASVRPASSTECPFAKAAPAVQTARVGSIAAAVDGGGSAHPLAFAAETPRRMTALDQVIPDDLIVQSSLCVGFDCINNEVFSFDTIRLKENNLRIKFQDTSGGSFPTRDWEIEANSSANGGQTHFRINDVDGARSPLTIEGNASTHSIYVDSTGRVGLRTSTPVLDLHINTSNTPGIRLEQNNSGGFTAQTWDIAGNEANFFVRDVTGGSRLPFRIRPGAPTSSIDISADGDVGFGTTSPDAALDIERAGAGAAVTMLRFTNTNGPSRFEFRDNTGAIDWDFRTTSGDAFVITQPTSPTNDFQIQSNGNVTVRGTLTTNGPTCAGGCDAVLAPDYALESIAEHAAAMLSNSFLPAVGPTEPHAPMNLSEKTGGILNELEKAHLYIVQLDERNRQLEAQQSEMLALLAELKATLAEIRAQ